MKKRWFPVLCALLTLLTACGAPDGGAVSTDGSTSMSGVMAALQESYRDRAPGITVNYSGTGSGAGVEAVLSGACDIGLASRELTEAETARGAQGHLLALDGVAVVVHPDNPVRDLTRQQLAAVFTGLISSWDQLGGGGTGPIAVCGREAGSGTRAAFESNLGVPVPCVYTGEYGSAGDVLGAVAANPGAIGYISLSALSDRVVPLSVDGAACTPETLTDGSYPIWRPFLLVTAGDAPGSAAARDFLDFALSPGAGDALRAAGVAAPSLP